MENQTREILLLKLGEVVLKGLNRRRFEDKLMANAARRLRKCGRFQISIRQSTIYAEPLDDNCDMDAAYQAARQIFGIVRVARACPCEKDMEKIALAIKNMLSGEFQKARSFKVETKRADKNFYLNSIEISRDVGGRLSDFFPAVKVDVHDPDLIIYIEIREKAAYIHLPAAVGAGGLPVGTGGRALSLLSGGLDSPVASYMLARRGVELEMIHFASPPYTSEQAREKVLNLAKILTPYCGRLPVHIMPFTHIQEEIRRNCPEEFFTIIMRRFMMRLAEQVASQIHAKALITGESLGQVASQTMDALRVTEDVVNLPVFRPLIGMDKIEIIKISRQIGTYETSILPYEDCCTVFTPRRPATRPDLNQVREAESKLNIEALCAESLSGAEPVIVKS